MAVPFVGSIYPSTGPAIGGTLVRLLGGNFRVPDPPDLTVVGPVPAPAPTVEVTVGGVASSRVIVASAGKIYFSTPKKSLTDSYGRPEDGPLSEDVVVTNVDDDGAPIVGETVTVTDGFEYARVDLSSSNQSTLTTVHKALIVLMRDELIGNVVDHTHSDYDDTEEDLKNVIAIAELPAIVITGPDLPRNTLHMDYSGAISDGKNGDVLIHRRPRYRDLEYDVGVISDNTAQFLNLVQAVDEFLDRNTTITVSCAPNPDLELELHVVQDFVNRRVTGNAKQNLHVARSRIKIEALNFAGFEGFVNDAVTGATRPVEEVSLRSVPVVGENQPEVHGGPVRSPPPRGGR